MFSFCIRYRWKQKIGWMKHDLVGRRPWEMLLTTRVCQKKGAGLVAEVGGMLTVSFLLRKDLAAVFPCPFVHLFGLLACLLVGAYDNWI